MNIRRIDFFLAFMQGKNKDAKVFQLLKVAEFNPCAPHVVLAVKLYNFKQQILLKGVSASKSYCTGHFRAYFLIFKTNSIFCSYSFTDKMTKIKKYQMILMIYDFQSVLYTNLFSTIQFTFKKAIFKKGSLQIAMSFVILIFSHKRMSHGNHRQLFFFSKDNHQYQPSPLCKQI